MKGKARDAHPAKERKKGKTQNISRNIRPADRD
jgi:hypothetical protein